MSRQARISNLYPGDLPLSEAHRLIDPPAVKLQVEVTDEEFTRFSRSATESRIPLPIIVKHLLRLWSGMHTKFTIYEVGVPRPRKRPTKFPSLPRFAIYTPPPSEVIPPRITLDRPRPPAIAKSPKE